MIKASELYFRNREIFAFFDDALKERFPDSRSPDVSAVQASIEQQRKCKVNVTITFAVFI